jgi:hypothetical protein
MRFLRFGLVGLLATQLAGVGIAQAGDAPADPAQGWLTLGFGRVFTNDALGDLTDRWRTGSYTVGRFRSRAPWPGELPPVPGQVLEWRIRGEMIAPATLDAPEPGDRRYAGMLGFGLHSYWRQGGLDIRAGADLVVTGPATRLDELQAALHDILSLPKPDATNQIGDAVYPTVSLEAGRDLALGQGTLRPFVEAQAGVESFGRVGVDVVLGTHGDGGLLMRDPVTGHRVTGVRGAGTAGFSLILGADTAYVWDSRLLPDGGDAVLAHHRHRVRVGGHWMGSSAEVFYGVSWLSEEFLQQDEGQVVGALNLRLLF